jgi:hypothetical protein
MATTTTAWRAVGDPAWSGRVTHPRRSNARRTRRARASRSPCRDRRFRPHRVSDGLHVRRGHTHDHAAASAPAVSEFNGEPSNRQVGRRQVVRRVSTRRHQPLRIRSSGRTERPGGGGDPRRGGRCRSRRGPAAPHASGGVDAICRAGSVSSAGDSAPTRHCGQSVARQVRAVVAGPGHVAVVVGVVVLLWFIPQSIPHSSTAQRAARRSSWSSEGSVVSIWGRSSVIVCHRTSRLMSK